MITPKNVKKSDAKRMIDLITEWTRAEIMSRLGRFDNLEFADYFMVKIEKENEIRELLFGTSDLVVLGKRWELLKEKHRRRKKVVRKS